MSKPENVQPLVIFNASAGSGKTFTLVETYLLLILKEDIQTFSKIIAMTFTNKAALEMKIRIIETLDKLSFPEIHKEESISYATKLGKEIGMTTEEVALKCKRILFKILHNYEDFFVLTIDKFNLKLIRSFSRDLELPNDFEVVLNEGEIIEQVVDNMLNELGKENAKELTQLVLEYAKQNLDDGEKWNFRNQLIAFGTILNKEKDQELIEKLLKMDFSPEQYKKLKNEQYLIRDAFLGRCKQTFDCYLSFDIDPKMLPKASITSNAIEKLNTYKDVCETLFSQTVTDAFEKETPPKKFFPEPLKEALKELNAYYHKIRPTYFLKKQFIKNFYNMSLLQHMAKSIENIKKDEQLLRISEFNKLISKLVRNESAPFIYERLGTRYKHFLLDEFQDTSRLQWLNMVPLIRESISSNHKNLIVGDPKQSIYRFKNGLAEQFVALPKIYNPENSADIEEFSNYFEKMGVAIPLTGNWRSAIEIVEFNNSFFKEIKNTLSDEQKEFYESIHQTPKKEFKGYVNVTSQNVKQVDLENTLDTIVSQIEACLADDFEPADICILGETNRKTSQWAIGLTKRGYKIVSNDSLMVHSDLCVRLTVSYLKRRLNPSSKHEMKRFAELFFRSKGQNEILTYRSYFETYKNKEGAEYSSFNEGRFLITHFENRDNFFINYETIYDLVLSFYGLMGWDELDNPYLHHFADFVHEFEIKKGPDLKEFIEYYEEQKGKLAIQIPESRDAIQMMTVHKSKGLEFPVVILPDVDYDTDIKSRANFLIESDDCILYTTLKKDSPVEQISAQQRKEKSQVLLDKLNLCYVAFTRAERRLYISNIFSKNKLGATIHDIFKKLECSTQGEDELITIEYGEKVPFVNESKKKDADFFIPKKLGSKLWFPDIALQEQPNIEEDNILTKERRYGNQFHLSVSSINNAEEIEMVLNDLRLRGEVENDFYETIKHQITELFQSTYYSKILDGATTILNEQEIIIDEKTTIRPDKIVFKQNEIAIVDFKTGLPKENHKSQLYEYMKAMQGMGYSNVKGHLYYSAKKEFLEL
jgi:ATP-dependent exoDNAse (exonuclease V) beta subunit